MIKVEVKKDLNGDLFFHPYCGMEKFKEIFNSRSEDEIVWQIIEKHAKVLPAGDSMKVYLRGYSND